MRVVGRNLNLRLVDLSDAEFIYKLRQDVGKSKYLSKVVGAIEDQYQWLAKYKERENLKEEFYFVIESKSSDRLGLVRMYDYRGDSFCWGSWLIKDNAPKYTAIESALQIYELAFYKMGFNQSHFDVRKGNERVIAFHKRFGAQVVDESEDDYFFVIKKEDYECTKLKYKRYLK